MTHQKPLLAAALAVIFGTAVGGHALAADDPVSAAPETGGTVSGGTEHGPAVQADSLIGHDVVDANGDKIGSVQSVIVGDDGQAEAVVVGVGGFLGVGERNVALDWSQLALSDDGEVLALGLTKDELEALPEYQMQ